MLGARMCALLEDRRRGRGRRVVWVVRPCWDSNCEGLLGNNERPLSQSNGKEVSRPALNSHGPVGYSQWRVGTIYLSVGTGTNSMTSVWQDQHNLSRASVLDQGTEIIQIRVDRKQENTRNRNAQHNTQGSILYPAVWNAPQYQS